MFLLSHASTGICYVFAFNEINDYNDDNNSTT